MPVYFIRAGENGPVKIGWAKDPKVRLISLRAAHFSRLSLIRECDGDRREEAWLHRQFEQSKIIGEWFEFSPEMLVIEIPDLDAEFCNTPNSPKSLREYLGKNHGLQSKLADVLGITSGAISQWKRVPARYVLKIERYTGVSRHDLRPDIYPREDAA